jgi:hypothetical protein
MEEIFKGNFIFLKEILVQIKKKMLVISYKNTCMHYIILSARDKQWRS